MNTFDPFAFFRTTLFIALAVYTVVTMAATVIRVVHLLTGRDPSRQLLREYLAYQLASIRLRPLAGELSQLAVAAAILLLIWWLHTRP